MTSSNPEKPLNRIRSLLTKFFYSIYGKILGIIWIALFIICGIICGIQPDDLPGWLLFIVVAPLWVIIFPFSVAVVYAMGRLFIEWLLTPRTRWQWEIMIIDSIKALLTIAIPLGMLYGFIRLMDHLMDYLFD